MLAVIGGILARAIVIALGRGYGNGSIPWYSFFFFLKWRTTAGHA